MSGSADDLQQLREENARLKAELQAARDTASKVCPFDLPDDPRANIDEDVPCPVCGMLGTKGAEDKCVGPPRVCSPRPD